MPDGPLEDALDELYGAEPSEFVATRKRLSASLRDAGDKAGAKVLQGARRPSTSAWALNQLARQLRSGRLVREGSSSGFPDAAGLTLVPDLPAPTAATKPKAAKRATNR